MQKVDKIALKALLDEKFGRPVKVSVTQEQRSMPNLFEQADRAIDVLRQTGAHIEIALSTVTALLDGSDSREASAQTKEMLEYFVPEAQCEMRSAFQGISREAATTLTNRLQREGIVRDSERVAGAVFYIGQT